MLYKSLIAEARALSSESLAVPYGRKEWKSTFAERRSLWLEMLGLKPMPKRTPLKAVVTGMLDHGDIAIEKLHFQSLPGAFVPGNLYRPAKIKKPLPAVLYLCGHSADGKAAPAYQAHGRWFARHGYVALVLDPIQVGEGQGYHHGVYFKNRFDWFSRGYTPAGVEVWNAVRALDYLQSRDDVNGSRLGVSGISGGGAMSWFLAAADDRIACVAPVCQTGTIEQHAVDRTVDGHCDCAFWVNMFRWCTPDIAALIAPRPLLIASGVDDIIWRPFAFHGVYQKVKRQYEALGAGAMCDFVEDFHEHGYTPLLRKTVMAWFDRHLKVAAEPVTDDVDEKTMPVKELLVFDGNPPAENRMASIDEEFVKTGPATPPSIGGSELKKYSASAIAELKRLAFSRTVPDASPRLLEIRDAGAQSGIRWRTWLFETDDGVELKAHLSEPDGKPPDGDTTLVLRRSSSLGRSGAARRVHRYSRVCPL